MEEKKKRHIEIPGTLVLVFIFFAWFVFMYFANWAALSELWSIK